MDLAGLSGTDKAAVVLLSLPEDAARTLLGRLSEVEVEEVLAAVATLETVPPETQAAVLEEFRARIEANDGIRGGAPRALDLIERALPEERAESLRIFYRRKEEPISWQLHPHTPTFIAHRIDAEDIQTIALILSQLPAPRGAAVMAALSETTRAPVIRRLASLEPVAAEVLEDVAKGLEELFSERLRTATTGRGVSAAAEVLAQMRKADGDALLESLRVRDERIAEEIRRSMLTFDHLAQIDDRGFKKLLQNIPVEDLVIALKAASETIRDKVLSNLSNRARQSLLEEQEMMPPRRLSEVEAKQREIVDLARSLADQGEISLGDDADETLV
ncbi:hypothetical protein KJ059_04550 [Myxococcota bacterium]|nr:hypothetical protein [Myxococcota bacterium]MCZ7617298.1 hypothetical protein [Myxococcota bacterium]